MKKALIIIFASLMLVTNTLFALTPTERETLISNYQNSRYFRDTVRHFTIDYEQVSAAILMNADDNYLGLRIVYKTGGADYIQGLPRNIRDPLWSSIDSNFHTFLQHRKALLTAVSNDLSLGVIVNTLIR